MDPVEKNKDFLAINFRHDPLREYYGMQTDPVTHKPLEIENRLYHMSVRADMLTHLSLTKTLPENMKKRLDAGVKLVVMGTVKSQHFITG